MQYNYTSLIPIFITAFLGLLSAFLLFIIKRQKEKIDTIQAQLSDKKYHVYYEIHSIVFDMIKQSKGLIELNHDDLLNRLFDIKKELLIYSTDTIIKKFMEWMALNEGKKGDTVGQILAFLDLLVLTRKDMGQKSTILTNKDVLELIMGKKEYEIFAKEYPHHFK